MDAARWYRDVNGVLELKIDRKRTKMAQLIILKDVFLSLLTPYDIKVYISELFKCFK